MKKASAFFMGSPAPPPLRVLTHPAGEGILFYAFGLTSIRPDISMCSAWQNHWQ